MQHNRRRWLIFVSDKLKDKFSKPSIIRRSNFCQRCWVGRPNWRIFERNRVLEFFFGTIVFVLDIPKEKFKKPTIIHHLIFRQHSCVGRTNWWIFDGKPSTEIFYEIIVMVLDIPKKTFIKPRLSATRLSAIIWALVNLIGGNLICKFFPTCYFW